MRHPHLPFLDQVSMMTKSLYITRPYQVPKWAETLDNHISSSHLAMKSLAQVIMRDLASLRKAKHLSLDSEARQERRII
jgi:hypothetical protein